MRLLVLSNYYPPHSIGSYELQCFQVSHELSKRGYQVQVLTAKRAGADRTYYSEAKVFRELELYDEDPPPNPGFHRLFRTVRHNRRVLARRLAEFVPEAIMIWGMDRLPISLLEVAEESGIPCVYAVYDHWLGRACDRDGWWNYWSEEDAIDAPLMRTFLRGLRLDKMVQRQASFGGIEKRRFENIYFCSESLKGETVRACGCPPTEKAMVIPCAISMGDIRRKEGQAGQSSRLLYIARLSEEKDPMTALRALQELRHRGDDRFTLDLYGRGKPEFETALHEYVRRFQLGGSVSFKPMSEEQVRHNIHLYDALVFTSRFPEPFPLVHLKAMAARVPVISTLDGGSGELIRHGENGFAFQAGNHYELADRIASIADHPELVERVVKTAYEEVSQHYTLGRVVSRIESLLHRAARSEGALREAV